MKFLSFLACAGIASLMSTQTFTMEPSAKPMGPYANTFLLEPLSGPFTPTTLIYHQEEHVLPYLKKTLKRRNNAALEEVMRLALQEKSPLAAAAITAQFSQKAESKIYSPPALGEWNWDLDPAVVEAAQKVCDTYNNAPLKDALRDASMWVVQEIDPSDYEDSDENISDDRSQVVLRLGKDIDFQETQDAEISSYMGIKEPLAPFDIANGGVVGQYQAVFSRFWQYFSLTSLDKAIPKRKDGSPFIVTLAHARYAKALIKGICNVERFFTSHQPKSDEERKASAVLLSIFFPKIQAYQEALAHFVTTTSDSIQKKLNAYCEQKKLPPLIIKESPIFAFLKTPGVFTPPFLEFFPPTEFFRGVASNRQGRGACAYCSEKNHTYALWKRFKHFPFLRGN